jgi:hypothetical protein
LAKQSTIMFEKAQGSGLKVSVVLCASWSVAAH